MATKPKTAPQVTDAPATNQAAGSQEQDQEQPGASDGAQSEEAQMPAEAGVADGQAAGAVMQQDPSLQEVQLVDVRVLAAVSIEGERFLPDEVIEGMPESVAQAYADRVDSHPDAVAYARSIDAPVKPFPGLAHAED